VLQGIPRDRRGYEGLVNTDDIEMQAITENFALEEVLVRALNAGVDNLLACHTAEVAHSAIDLIAKAVERGDVDPAKFAAAEQRLLRFSERYATPPLASPELERLGSAEHVAVIDAVRRRVDASTIEPGVDPTEVMEMIRRKQRLKKA
jgi:beta-N-acetylhexosaminidase